MPIKLFLLLLLFFSITPNLGFFTVPSVLTIGFILVCYFLVASDKLKKLDDFTPFLLFLLLFYAAFYYGGIYQEQSSIITGQIIFFLFLFLLLLNFFFPRFKFLDKFIFPLGMIVFLFLSFWTILNSPNPACDCFSVLKEAPLKFLSGQNPYSSVYSSVYPGVVSNYFPYLPFSFIYFLPFVVLFSDQRFGSLLASLVSAYLLVNLFKAIKNRRILNLLVFVFLFLPRSFFMLEHSYQDIIIFSFFLLFIYLRSKGKIGLSFLALGLFFSFKQQLFLLLPLFLNKKFLDKRMVFLILPALLPLYFFLINGNAFLRNTVFFLLDPSKGVTPVNMSLSMVTLFKNYLPFLSISLLSLTGMIIWLGVYFFVFRSSFRLLPKIIIILLTFHLSVVYSFFNYYYFIALFLFLDINLDDNLKIKTGI